MKTKVPATGKTRSVTKAATKPASPKPVAKPAAPIAKPAAPVVNTPDAPQISKKELLERIVDESGMKRSDVRQALDATLRVLGAAIGEGSTIAAAPMGKIKVARTKETPNGKLAVCRIKLK